MLRCAVNSEELAVSIAAAFREGYLLLAGEILTGNGGLAFEEFVNSTGEYHLTAVNACSRTDVYNVVSGKDSIVIMLDNDEGISNVTQALQGSYQLIVVTLMQTDAWLVQDIQNAHQ